MALEWPEFSRAVACVRVSFEEPYCRAVFTFTFICHPGKTHNHRSRGDTPWRAQTNTPRPHTSTRVREFPGENMLTSNCRLPRYPGFSIRIHVQEHVVSGVQAVMVHVVCRSGTFLGLLVERERARVRERNSPPTPLTCPRSIAPRAFRKVSMPQSIICEHTHARRQREAVGANAASSGAAPPLSLVSGRGRCHSGAPCLSRRPAHAVARARPNSKARPRGHSALRPKNKMGGYKWCIMLLASQILLSIHGQTGGPSWATSSQGRCAADRAPLAADTWD